jgi:hypothetical protein
VFICSCWWGLNPGPVNTEQAFYHWATTPAPRQGHFNKPTH